MSLTLTLYLIHRKVIDFVYYSSTIKTILIQLNKAYLTDSKITQQKCSLINPCYIGQSSRLWEANSRSMWCIWHRLPLCTMVSLELLTETWAQSWDYIELIWVNVRTLPWIWKSCSNKEVIKWLSGNLEWLDYVVSAQVTYTSLSDSIITAHWVTGLCGISAGHLQLIDLESLETT